MRNTEFRAEHVKAAGLAATSASEYVSNIRWLRCRYPSLIPAYSGLFNKPSQPPAGPHS
jgi:hypothetical protein